MNLNDLHLDQVPQNPETIQSATTPSLAAPKKYEDLLEVDVAENVRSAEPPKSREFQANLKRWYLRLN